MRGSLIRVSSSTSADAMSRTFGLTFLSVLRSHALLIFRVASLLIFYIIGIAYYNREEGWSVIDCVYFITVAVTTVGYGYLHPTSDSSRIFTSFFILAGLAFVLIAVDDFAKYFIIGAQKRLLDWCYPRITMLERSTKKLSMSFMGLIVLSMVGVAYYSTNEEWTGATAFYWTIITMTTVGFGDLEIKHESTRIFTIFFIVLCVISYATALHNLGEVYILATEGEQKRMLQLSALSSARDTNSGNSGNSANHSSPSRAASTSAGLTTVSAPALTVRSEHTLSESHYRANRCKPVDSARGNADYTFLTVPLQPQSQLSHEEQLQPSFPGDGCIAPILGNGKYADLIQDNGLESARSGEHTLARDRGSSGDSERGALLQASSRAERSKYHSLPVSEAEALEAGVDVRRIGTASAFANFATQMTTAPSTQATALCSNSALPSQVLYNKEATGTGYSTGGGSYSSSNSNSNISIHIGPGGEGGVSSSSSEDCALYLLGVLTQMHPQPLHAPLRASLERLRNQYLQNVAPPARLRLPPQILLQQLSAYRVPIAATEAPAVEHSREYAAATSLDDRREDAKLRRAETGKGGSYEYDPNQGNSNVSITDSSTGGRSTAATLECGDSPSEVKATAGFDAKVEKLIDDGDDGGKDMIGTNQQSSYQGQVATTILAVSSSSSISSSTPGAAQTNGRALQGAQGQQRTIIGDSPAEPGTVTILADGYGDLLGPPIFNPVSRR